jgi:hypothetical protein
LSTGVFLSSHKKFYGEIQWVSLSSLFTLSYLVVYYQLVLSELLGYSLPMAHHYFIWPNENVVNLAFMISTLGLLFFQAAFYFGARRSALQPPEHNRNPSYSTFLLILLSYLCYFFFLASSGSYVLGEYTPDNASQASSYFYKMFKVSLSAALILKASNISCRPEAVRSLRQYCKSMGLPLVTLVLFHIFFSLYVGDRGPVIYFSLMFFGLFAIRKLKLSLITVAITVVSVSLLLSLVGDVRQARFSGQDYWSRVKTSVGGLLGSGYARDGNGMPAEATIELAYSVRTLNHAVANVPSKYPHMYGLFQAQYFYSIVPGLSNQINLLIFEGDRIYDGSSNFITYLIRGRNPSSGDGSSIVADLYLDFGVIGVACGLALFGFFVGRNESRLFAGSQSSDFLWVATMVYFANSIYLSRSALMLELSNVVLIYLLILLSNFIARRVVPDSMGNPFSGRLNSAGLG